MSWIINFRPEAERDLIQARDWYAAQKDGLGFDFINEITKSISMIQINPLLFGRVIGEVRASKTKRFPYIIYFRLVDNIIEVIAVFHARRDHKDWKMR